MKKVSLILAMLALALALGLVLAGCDMGVDESELGYRVTVSPKYVTLAPGTTQVFTATVTATRNGKTYTGNFDKTVTWWLRYAYGRSGTVKATITPDGMLTIANDESYDFYVYASPNAKRNTSDFAFVTVSR